MTDIAKVVVDGEEHWTAAGSPRHKELLARQLDAQEQDGGDSGQAPAGQIEEGGGGEQQEPEVHGDSDDHDAVDAGGEPGDGKAADGAAAGGTRRARSSESAAGS